MIREMVYNQRYNADLAVTYASEKTGKTGKAYLDLVLSDGVDTITAKMWNWRSGNKIPDKEHVWTFTGKCTNYQNEKKQFIVDSFKVNESININQFLPNSGKDIDAVYNEAVEIANQIEDKLFKDMCIYALDHYKDLWLTVPGATKVHHNYIAGTLIHCTSVAKIARAIAENTEGAWTDLVTCAALLHDIGKLFTYRFEGADIEMTNPGIFFDHLYIGTRICEDIFNAVRSDPTINEREKLMLIQHMTLSHHRQKEFGSTITPKFQEAWIVAFADDVDSKCEIVRAASRRTDSTKQFTDKQLYLGGDVQFTVEAVQAIRNNTTFSG